MHLWPKRKGWTICDLGGDIYLWIERSTSFPYRNELIRLWEGKWRSTFPMDGDVFLFPLLKGSFDSSFYIVGIWSRTILAVPQEADFTVVWRKLDLMVSQPSLQSSLLWTQGEPLYVCILCLELTVISGLTIFFFPCCLSFTLSSLSQSGTWGAVQTYSFSGTIAINFSGKWTASFSHIDH